MGLDPGPLRGRSLIAKGEAGLEARCERPSVTQTLLRNGAADGARDAKWSTGAGTGRPCQRRTEHNRLSATSMRRRPLVTRAPTASLPQTCSMLDNTLGRRRRVGAALTRSQSPALHLLIRLAAALVDDFGVAAH